MENVSFSIVFLEQATGIEPARSAWEAEILPLNYACKIKITMTAPVTYIYFSKLYKQSQANSLLIIRKAKRRVLFRLYPLTNV